MNNSIAKNEATYIEFEMGDIKFRRNTDMGTITVTENAKSDYKNDNADHRRIQ